MSDAVNAALMEQLKTKANSINDEIQRLRSLRLPGGLVTRGSLRYYNPPNDPVRLITYVEALLVTLDTERKRNATTSSTAGRSSTSVIDTKITALLTKIDELNL